LTFLTKMPQYFQKPENALKRAQEFIEIGKKEQALDVLYDVIKSKKHRNWQKIHEPILQSYLRLCVELKRSVNAKEGLYQYKLICQQVNIASLEEIISYFLKLAEKHADDAKSQSIDKVTVEDLDQVQTPEGLMLSSVSSEDAQDRSDRVLLTPWVKFLWEAYRNILELLRNNNRVERLYHETAQSAFKFCLKFTRRAEFRKLCSLVKNHLDQVLKYQGQPTAINMNNPDSLQMHLETRLFQLESAITMELWQEAFKAVEGIHSLMLMSKKPAKPHMMANYFEKVALVFLKAQNLLFHAASLLKLFVLTKEQKKTVTAEELEKIGKKVLLATLSIPIPPEKSSMEEHLSYDSNAFDKSRRLTTLLRLINIPTRKSLMADVELLILPHMSPELKELFFVMEKRFHPLKICKDVHSVLKNFAEDEQLVQYVQHIQDITVIRMLKQASQVYETLSFTKLLKWIPFMNNYQLERIIVNCVKQCDMQININHQTKAISFGSVLMVALKEEVAEGPFIQAMPSEILRSQLSSLSEGIQSTNQMIRSEEIVKAESEVRQTLVNQYQKQERKEHGLLLNRKLIIEARKERIEHIKNAQERRDKEKANRQREKLRMAEEQRLEAEREKRELERRRQEMKEIQKQQVWDRVDSLRGTDVGKRAFKNLSTKEIDEMDPDDILRRQYEQLEMEKRELAVKLRTQEKRMDHLVRAIRQEEVPLLEKHISEKKVKDREDWEKSEEERIANAEKEHKVALKTQSRLERMASDKETFLNSLLGNRRSDYEARLADFDKHLGKVREERLEERKRQRMAKRREEFIKIRREEKRKEREEQLQREKELEEIRKQKEAEERRKEEEERRKRLDEIERKKREKEAEIEDKMRRRETDSQSRPQDPPPSRDEGGWRRAGESAQSPAPPSGGGGGGKYVPPSQRRKQESSAPPPSDDRREGDRGFGDRGGGDSWRGDDRDNRDNRGYGGDRDRGYGGDRDRGYGGDRDRGYGGDRDRGYGGDRDRGYGDRDRGTPDRRGGGGYDRRDDRRDDSRGGSYNRPQSGWRDGGGDSWRSGGGARSEGRSYQASRVRSDRDRGEERSRDERGGGDEGWTTVGK